MPRISRPLPVLPAERGGDGRLAWSVLSEESTAEADGSEIVAGLSARPKTLPCRFFYDERGSRLFERICELPEYYLTRTERALLAGIAPEVAERTRAGELVELGSGSSSKTRLLIDALSGGAWRPGAPLRYVAIDVSASSLRDGMEALLARYGTLELSAIVGSYEAGLAALARGTEAPPRLVLFLGSTIGNLTPEETGTFLARVRGALRPGDWFLVGTDLEKDTAVIEAAYNDSQRVTAAFNLNILRHINRRFRGDFSLDRFAHLALYNRERRQIEMHLRSIAAQKVRLAALDFEVALAAGETIETEISRKFELADFGAELAAHGFEIAAQWSDPRRWFGVTLGHAV